MNRAALAPPTGPIQGGPLTASCRRLAALLVLLGSRQDADRAVAHARGVDKARKVESFIIVK